jgi:hypothetical protein
MRTSRARRPEPERLSPEEEAEIEAKYRLLHRLLKRYAARMEARYPGYWARKQGARAESRPCAESTLD